jgi:hypothetical protein
MPLLTLKEAAAFLRKSPSWLYQNKTVPRHRPPGTRRWLFDSDELMAWVKTDMDTSEKPHDNQHVATNKPLEVCTETVYHRNPIYR